MSPRRTVCGLLTADGSPCQNGKGCTVNHHTTLSGQPPAAAVAVGGAGPDPLTVGGAAAAPAGGLDDVLAQLADEADGDPTIVGHLFEPVAVEWLKRVNPATQLGVFAADPGGEPTVGDIKEDPRGDRQVVSWSEYTKDDPELGVDAVATMGNGELVAIQIKTGESNLTAQNISTFVAKTVADRGERTYEYQVLIFTNIQLSDDAVTILEGHAKMLLIDGNHFEGAVPDGGWQKLLDDTKDKRVAWLQKRRSPQRGQGDGSVEAGGTKRNSAGTSNGKTARTSWEDNKARAHANTERRRANKGAAKANGGGGSSSQKKAAQHAALAPELAALGLDPGVLSEELGDAVGSAAADYEGATRAAVSDRGAQLGLAARQTVLYEYHSAAADAVNGRRKVTMSVLRDDHGLISSTLARLITSFTPAARMAEVRAKAAKKAAAKGKDVDPDSVDAITGTRAQQMAIEGAEIRGTKKEEKKKKKSGRPKQPAERRLATAYQHLVALKATDPDRYDRIIADLGDAAVPEEEASP